MSKTDVVPAPFELTDYGRDRKVPITKEFDKCHRGICPGCRGVPKSTLPGESDVSVQAE